METNRSELSEPKKFLYTEEIKNILSAIFKRAKSERPSFDASRFRGSQEKMEN